MCSNRSDSPNLCWKASGVFKHLRATLLERVVMMEFMMLRVRLKLLKLCAVRIAETVTLMVVLMFVDVKGDDVRTQDVGSW